MNIRKNFSTQKSFLKNLTFKEKLGYFWDYYKLPFFLIIFVSILSGSVIHSRITSKDCVLNGQFLNTVTDESQLSSLTDSFLSDCPINIEKEEIYLGTSLFYRDESDYESLQVLAAQIAAGDVDFMVAEQDLMAEFAYNDYFLDLSTILPDEVLEKYKPYILYCDKAFIEWIHSPEFLYGEAEEIHYPDPAKPELMEDPVPIIIQLSSEQLPELYPFQNTDYAFAFAANGEHPDKALDFLNFILTR